MKITIPYVRYDVKLDIAEASALYNAAEFITALIEVMEEKGCTVAECEDEYNSMYNYEELVSARNVIENLRYLKEIFKSNT